MKYYIKYKDKEETIDHGRFGNVIEAQNSVHAHEYLVQYVRRVHTHFDIRDESVIGTVSVGMASNGQGVTNKFVLEPVT